jgi:asparagine synthase (glutamine-hydrolysing)
LSGICGVVNLDGAPADVGMVQQMAAAAAYRGPDGISYWAEGCVAFAHLALHSTPEACREKQPLTSRDGRLVLVADARVDNRSDLINALASTGYLCQDDPTDADLILAAYQRWGADCGREIVGDYAFVMWDSRGQKLVCVRDAVGVRPLFYCQQGQTLYVASAISSVLAALPRTPSFNQPLIVDYLCWRFDRWIWETPYEGIHRVPPSYFLLAGPAGCQLQRYWSFGQAYQPHFRRDEEYIEHFRELFAEAVRCRLRSPGPAGPIGMTASGGLDSSSIVCMAHYLVDQGITPSGPAFLYSWACQNFRTGDEREYQAAVHARCHRFTARIFDADQYWEFQESGRDGGFPYDEPDAIGTRSSLTALLQQAREDGCRAMLWGDGGDEVLNPFAYAYPEVLLSLSTDHLLSEWPYYWKLHGLTLPGKIAWSLARPYVPQSWKESLRKWRRRQQAPIWLSQKWLGEAIRSESEFKLGRGAAAVGRTPARLLQNITRGFETAMLGHRDRSCAFHSIESRFPYLDRRLADYLLTVPVHLLSEHGLGKQVLRRAMNGILPNLIIARSGGAIADEAIGYGIQIAEKRKVDILIKSIDKHIKGGVRYPQVERELLGWVPGESEFPFRCVAVLYLVDWLNSE